jgi:hypothetical protein
MAATAAVPSQGFTPTVHMLQCPCFNDFIAVLLLRVCVFIHDMTIFFVRLNTERLTKGFAQPPSHILGITEGLFEIWIVGWSVEINMIIF